MRVMVRPTREIKMPVVKIRILGGKVTVEADGTAQSCSAAHDIQKALGDTISERPTGHKVETTKLVQR